MKSFIHAQQERISSLEMENAYLRERHAEAVAQLQPTIEVLEGFRKLEDLPGLPVPRIIVAWWKAKARPHLEHLKALAKEAEV